MTPSEIRIWEATYAAAFANIPGTYEHAADEAVDMANRCVLELRRCRAENGPHIGVRLPELPAKVAE